MQYIVKIEFKKSTKSRFGSHLHLLCMPYDCNARHVCVSIVGKQYLLENGYETWVIKKLFKLGRCIYVDIMRSREFLALNAPVVRWMD